jgi:hypothetical protein
MRAAPTFGGLAILALGLLMLNFGVYTYTVQVPKIETRILFDKERISSIGDFAGKELNLQKDWILRIEGEVRVPDTNSSGEINLYVMTTREYQRWRAGEKNIEYIIRREKVERFNETLVSAENETTYVIFDNRYDPKYKKEVTLSVKYTFETKVPETREESILKQAGYPLMILGAISLAYGLVRKPVVRWE